MNDDRARGALVVRDEGILSRGLAHAARIGEPSRAARGLTWGIAVVVAGLVVWAAVSEVDEVTRAGGRVIPSAKLQVVQSLEGGIVTAIPAFAGKRVEQGDLLVSLSPTQADGDYATRRQQVLGLSVRATRLQAELLEREPQFTPDMLRDAGEQVEAERRELSSRRDRRDAELAVLDSQLTQRQREAEDARAILVTVDSALRVAAEERQIVATLVERGLEPRLELVRLEARLVELEGRRESARLAIPRLEAAMTEARSRRAQLLKQLRNEAAAELSRLTNELNAQRQAMPALADRVERTELRAPVKGIVNRVLVSTVGGVVKPGEALVEVVPADDQLVVEAYIAPKDIGFVKIGQSARVKLTAYDYSIFGAMEGAVVHISADAVAVGERQSAYLARVETRTTAKDALGHKLPIIAGMQAEVNVITGQRTVLQYLTKPLVGVKENAFRER